MNFYTNVFMRGNNVYVRGYRDGERFSEIVKYKPYLFVPKKDGPYSTIHGQTCDKIQFDTIKDAREFADRYKDVDNYNIYGLNNFLYLFIYDNYKGDIDYDPSVVSVCSIDLECAADEGFPDIRLADKEITAITLRRNGKSVVLGCGDFTTTDKNIQYIKCRDEKFLLEKFITVWQSKYFSPDIVTGWNIELFDIPYLINRIRRVLGDKEHLRLSPWSIVEEKEIEFKGKQSQAYALAGISNLDYYQLYRKFTFGNQESYKLNYIAQIELGEQKLDYSEHGSLLDLYKNNFQKFIEYNIHDVVLVDKLEDKLKFIEQVMAIAYDAKVNYADAFTTVRSWDVIIHNYLLDQKIVIPQTKVSQKDSTIVGGYVKDPKIGLSKWIVSFDLNSLYPHLIMQFNISPDTYIDKIQDFYSIDELLDGKFQIKDADRAYTANGCMFRKDKQGFLPALMEKMYNDRVKYKKEMIEAKKQYEKTPTHELEKQIARCHNVQLAKKIQLNSAYGALANVYFRWYNNDHASSITTSGQLSVRWIERTLNTLMNKLAKTENVDYVVAIDTDSVYVEMDCIVSKLGTKDTKKIVETLDKFCEEKIQKHINKSYEDLAEYMSAYQQKMFMKRETIADKGIWTGKKHYILNAWNVEGVQYDKPKIKMQGIEAVRSSTPQACRESIKKALEIIMNDSEQELQKFVADFKDSFHKMSFQDVAFPRGVQDMDKYSDKSATYKKGTPIAVRGSLLFNKLLRKHNIKHIPPINNGDKIKFSYLKMPNPIHENVIASPEELPDKFNLHQYIDYTTQFEKAFLESIRSITSIIGWKVEKTNSLEDLFDEAG